jgi:hypothetical protein
VTFKIGNPKLEIRNKSYKSELIYAPRRQERQEYFKAILLGALGVLAILAREFEARELIRIRI